MEHEHHHEHSQHNHEQEITFKDYVPLIIVFAYIFFGTFALGYIAKDFSLKILMQYFMALFFVFFSLFKLVDLKEFAMGFSSYDLIASRVYNWGFVYPFLELFLGILYLLSINLFFTNIFTLVLTFIGALGIGKQLLRNSKFRCACLGSVIKLPISTISLYEYLLMFLMALIMLFI